MNQPPPKLRELAEHIERRMERRNGSVTLHFHDGILKKVEISTTEDARAMQRSP